MNAFTTRGGKRFGYDEAPVRGTQCVQSVGDACPYKRNRAVWFLWGTAIIDNLRFKLSKTDKHISLFPAA